MSAKVALLEGASERVRSLLADANRHEREANRSRARENYEHALVELREEPRTDLASSIIRWIGRTHLDDGDLDAASDCFLAARTVAERQEDLSVIAHSVHCEALVHHLRGELDRAVEKYEWAQKRARLVGEAKLDAMIHQNLGVIANLRGDLSSALEHYRKSLEAYRRLGLTEYVGPLRTNVARLQTDLRMWDQAQASLGRAYDECVESARRVIRSWWRSIGLASGPSRAIWFRPGRRVTRRTSWLLYWETTVGWERSTSSTESSTETLASSSWPGII